MKGRPRNPKQIGRIGSCLWLAGCLHLAAADVDVSNLPPAAVKQIDFARDIRPILEANCLRCHGPEKPKSDFRLDTRATALKGGDNGVDILPGNSAKSPLILNVAHLVEDMEMPPIGKGNQLSPAQVSLLRAWIDQGAHWDNAAPTNAVAVIMSPVVGGTAVSGDSKKFEEHYWQRDGLIGGVEQFEWFQQTSPDTKWLFTGHVLPDDYSLGLSVDRSDAGFIHSGWEQYRKYYDDTGGYYPALLPSASTLGADLYLDIGRAWVDFGLTLPHWPCMVLGYEYDYRQGNEATLEWGAVGSVPTKTRNIAPAAQNINEGTHIIKFDLDYDFKGVTIEDRFRGEFYHLSTGETNYPAVLQPQIVYQGTHYFQGANTIRLERKFNDWFFGSAGYLYSKLNSDATFNMSSPTLLQLTSLPQITLEKESNVGNLNGLFGPFDGLLISTAVQADLTRQHGIGAGTFDQQTLPPPFGNSYIPFTVTSDYDEASLEENLALRYSKIPFTGLYAEARMEQQNIGQYDQFSSPQDILNKAVFLQHTAFSGQSGDFRAGFDTSPWRNVAFNAEYRHDQDDSEYDGAPLVQPIKTAYPTFLLARQLTTDELQAKLVWHPAARFKTTLSYQYQATDYEDDTRSYISFGNVISPGGELTGGREWSHIFSINATVTPVSRLYLSTTFTYQISTLTTAANGSPAVAPYQGDIYTLLADGTYVLSQHSDLFAGYFFSEANYGQGDFATGLPLGMEYQQHSAQIGLTHRFNQNVSARLQYRFALYEEPSSGGATNYRAHSVFGTLTFRF